MADSEILVELLGQADISEVRLESGKPPQVKRGDAFEMTEGDQLATDDILTLLFATGGSRYVDNLNATPMQWSALLSGIGTVGVVAANRDGIVKARIVRRDPIKARSPYDKARNKSGAPHHKKTTERPRRTTTPRPGAGSPPPPRESKPAGGPTQRPTRPNITQPARPAAVKITKTPDRPPDMAAWEAMLAEARRARASDLHLVAGRPPLYRIGGELVAHGAPLDPEVLEATVLRILPEHVKARFEREGSADFALGHDKLGRFRVNVARQQTGVKASLRLILPEPPTKTLPDEIGRALEFHQGLILITGPTGHGKSTTLSAIVDLINISTTLHVISIEDPVEYIHPKKSALISQREVGVHTRGFQAALKASLREDPDVIVVGDLRDPETARLALAASETGHLVLGTMNTPSAAKAIERMIDMFPSGDQQQVRMSLAGGLKLVVGQRLVPTTDKGVAVAIELLPGSIALWNLIRDDKTFQIPSLQQRGRSTGVIRLDDSLADLVRSGRVTVDAARAVAEAPEKFDASLAGKPPPPPPVAVAEAAKEAPASTGGGGLFSALFGRKKN